MQYDLSSDNEEEEEEEEDNNNIDLQPESTASAEDELGILDVLSFTMSDMTDIINNDFDSYLEEAFLDNRAATIPSAVFVAPPGRWTRGETLREINYYPDYDCHDSDSSVASIVTPPARGRVATQIIQNPVLPWSDCIIGADGVCEV